MRGGLYREGKIVDPAPLAGPWGRGVRASERGASSWCNRLFSSTDRQDPCYVSLGRTSEAPMFGRMKMYGKEEKTLGHRLNGGLRGTDLSRLSEVLHKDDVSAQRIDLCVKDCSTVLRNSHPRRFAGRAVVQLENFRRPPSGEVEKSD
jgi:hypothetical protein